MRADNVTLDLRQAQDVGSSQRATQPVHNGATHVRRARICHTSWTSGSMWLSQGSTRCLGCDGYIDAANDLT